MDPEIEHLAAGAFRAVLRARGMNASPLRDLRIDYDVAHDHLIFSALFAVGLDYSWAIPMRRLHRPPSVGRTAFVDLERDLRSLYSRMYEDHLLQLELEPRREAIWRLQLEGARPDQVYEAQREYALFEEHIRRHHRQNPVRYVNAVATLTVSDVDDAGTVDVADMRRAMERYFHIELGAFGSASTTADPAAETKGLALLKAWLSPEQLASYERQSHFDVIGSDTGKRYRIRHGRQMNIDELDAKGAKVCGWCFLPEGGLVAGDCMLAQKIALETNEKAALKIANKFGGRSWIDPIFHAMFGGPVMPPGVGV